MKAGTWGGDRAEAMQLRVPLAAGAQITVDRDACDLARRRRPAGSMIAVKPDLPRGNHGDACHTQKAHGAIPPADRDTHRGKGDKNRWEREARIKNGTKQNVIVFSSCFAIFALWMT